MTRQTSRHRQWQVTIQDVEETASEERESEQRVARMAGRKVKKQPWFRRLGRGTVRFQPGWEEKESTSDEEQDG